MLLIHQSGAVKVGEVVRYTLTYTPLNDRILPSPTCLYVKIKNTSAIPLRAAYLHGPYTLHVATYPSIFNPNQKLQDSDKYGYPDFEPNLKAGGQWASTLTVPDDIRSTNGKVNTKLNPDGTPTSATWIIEIASQIIFSNTASVNFELLVARDERSLDMGFAAMAAKGQIEPGKVQDYQAHRRASEDRRRGPPKGVYSKSIELVVEDTVALWNKPSLPKWEGQDQPIQVVKTESNDNQSVSDAERAQQDDGKHGPERKIKQKKLHLVILTHGLHSNVGADMLYLKESIDATVKMAREEARKNKAATRQKYKSSLNVKRESKASPDVEKQDPVSSTAPLSGGQDELSDHEEDEVEDDSDDDEQVIVRGFSGNSVRTERGIQYLGKRLAKFVLTATYPDQPYLPASKSMSRSFSMGLKRDNKTNASHKGSSIHKNPKPTEKLPYKFTKISFIGHSLGGLIQTYAIAYIYKHSPDFFKQIKPENFVGMAVPFLGLSNENPIYVKFALDFGLVGRTGRDLGLTWRAPNIARTGWSAMVAGLGPSEKKKKEDDPRSKPLLRILPTGPAHEVLKMFTNRTVYSNVVNDGIVPLRTSCLLFLDWRGLERVENARRENGLITTMAQFGWNELTGANAVSHRPSSARTEDDTPQPSSPSLKSMVPLAPVDSEEQDFAKLPLGDISTRDAVQSLQSSSKATSETHPASVVAVNSDMDKNTIKQPPADTSEGPFSDFFNLFRHTPTKSGDSLKPGKHVKMPKVYQRAQAFGLDGEASSRTSSPDGTSRKTSPRPRTVRGESFEQPPPKTSFFEAAGDILNPPIPSTSWLIDPSSRSRTIFHDRVYHASDIPPPPSAKPQRPRFSRSISSESRTSNAGLHQRRHSTNSSIASRSSISSSVTDENTADTTGSSGMKIEEKIARAYHRDLSWRKVLVRLEPDAHNNMIVRRMFANAYGWDVVKHLCDTHFSGSYAARTADDVEETTERVPDPSDNVSHDGSQVEGQTDPESPNSPNVVLHPPPRTPSERREAGDDLPELRGSGSYSSMASAHDHERRWEREDSVEWDDAVFEGSDDDEDSNGDGESDGPFTVWQRFWTPGAGEGHKRGKSSGNGKAQLGLQTQLSPGPKIADVMTKSPMAMDAHRGIGVIPAEPVLIPQRAHTEQPKQIQVPGQEVDVRAVTAEEARPGNAEQEPQSEPVPANINTTEVGLGKTPEELMGRRSSLEVLKGPMK